MTNERRGDLGYRGDDAVYCAFCGKSSDQVTAMIAGPNGINICDECISVCADAMMRDLGLSTAFDSMSDEETAGRRGCRRAQDRGAIVEADIEDATPNPADILGNLPTPHELYAELSEHVVGQENAKRALSVAVYNHYKRISMESEAQEGDVELAKSNIMLLGPTGSGKTLLAQTLARTLRVPFAIADATTLTEAGYVGEDVENILLKLITAADFDIPRAEIGIIYIDEIDKIAGRRGGSGPDVSREGVQRDILPIVEGSTVNTKYGPVKTDYMLFIAAGAFHVAKVSDLIPELQGRFPVHVQLKSLTREDFQRILTQPDNALTLQYKALLAVDKVMLTFEDSAIEAIANAAFTANETAEDIGARRLHAVFEQVLEDISFNAGDENMPPFELTINGEYVQQHLSGENKPTDLRKYIL